MDNYKIPNTEEAISLLDELGYDTTGLNNRSNFLYAKSQDKNVFNGVICPEQYELISVAKLRDLVVLKRNDVRDATHRDKQQKSIYLTSDKVIYYWDSEWFNSAINKSNDYENYIANSLTPITQPQDPALISGAEAKLAWAKGESVQFRDEFDKWYADWTDLNSKKNGFWITDFDLPHHQFRLKPQTIKVELELPKPFDPKVGEVYHFIQLVNDAGVDCKHYCDDKYDRNHLRIGVWRTEAEAKQALEQLRKIRGAS